MVFVVKGGANVIPKSYFEKGLDDLITHNFREFDKFMVVSERRKYKPSEDPSIMAQKQGGLPEVCEVYFESEYLCDVTADKTPSQALEIINQALNDHLLEKFSKKNETTDNGETISSVK